MPNSVELLFQLVQLLATFYTALCSNTALCGPFLLSIIKKPLHNKPPYLLMNYRIQYHRLSHYWDHFKLQVLNLVMYFKILLYYTIMSTLD